MTKRLLIFLCLTCCMLVGTPMAVSASEFEYIQTEQIGDDISISVNGQTVTITGAQGMTLEVVSLAGRKVMTLKIDSPAQRVDLSVPKGCYILKVGKVVRKITVR